MFRKLLLVSYAVWSIISSGLATQTNAQTEIRRDFEIELDSSPDHVVISGDGRIAAVAIKRSLVVYDARDGSQLSKLELDSAIKQIDLGIDGSRIAIAMDQPTIPIFERSTSKVIQRLHRRDGPSFLRNDGQLGVAILNSGKKLVSTGSKSRMYFSDVKSGDWDAIMFIKYPSAMPVVSPDDKFVALFGAPNEREISGHLTMYRVRLGLQPMWTKWHDGSKPVRQATFSKDAKRVLTVGEDGIRVWETQSGDKVDYFGNTTEQRVLSARFVQDSKSILAVSNLGFLLFREGQKVGLREKFPRPHQNTNAMDSSFDGSRLVTWGGSSTVEFWTHQHNRIEE